MKERKLNTDTTRGPWFYFGVPLQKTQNALCRGSVYTSRSSVTSISPVDWLLLKFDMGHSLNFAYFRSYKAITIPFSVLYFGGTALQTGRSRVQFPIGSIQFFVDFILPAPLWPWGRINIWQKWVPGTYPGEKERPVCRVDNLTNFICRMSRK
jgi:hypothetical protein